MSTTGNPQRDRYRRPLGARRPNTVDVEFPIGSQEPAADSRDQPGFFNTDRVGQAICRRFVGALTWAGIRVFMDRKIPWMDNVFVDGPGHGSGHRFDLVSAYFYAIGTVGDGAQTGTPVPVAPGRRA